MLLLAAGLMALVEHVLELGVVLEHARVEMTRQRHAMGFEDGAVALTSARTSGLNILLLLELRSGSL